MGDLWERLKAAKEAVETRTLVEAGKPRPPDPPPIRDIVESPPEGWCWASPLVAERRFRFALDHRFVRALTGTVDWQDWNGICCFDTETTGLSGGAGTVAFLIGWATLFPAPAGPEVEIRQWFLRDLPGEPDLIAALDQVWAKARGLVSFNGASFDLPLLKTRWSLAGRRFPDLPHRDDLHPARRLWKRLLESCRLSRLEETVLGIHRPHDIPGALVPALWFDYLRRGAAADFASPLAGVFLHHAQDVYSLLCLDLVLSAMARDPQSSRWAETFGPFPRRALTTTRLAPEGLIHPDLTPPVPVDFWGLLDLRSPSHQEQVLEDAWRRHGTEELGLAWGRILKRRRDPRVFEVWTWLWETKRSYPALVESLKWLEHRVRGPQARLEALTRIDQALKEPFLAQSWRLDLLRRQSRMQTR